EEVSYELGGSLGIAIMGSIMSITYTYIIKFPFYFAGESIAQDSIDGALDVATGMEHSAGLVLVNLAKSAFDKAIFSVMGIAIILLLVVSGLIWLNFRRSSKCR
ncbi:MFS transporter, partial [Xenorhabdus bovienii]|nr:MFS transporter [Xenorhabdus bovienii]